MEKGPNFVDPFKKAEAMAYTEKDQREKDIRRERAGLPVDPEEKNRKAEQAGAEWQDKEDFINRYIEHSIDDIDKFIEEDAEDNTELHLTGFNQKFKDTVSEKLELYLGNDFPDISIDYEYSEVTGSFHPVLRRKESRED